MEEEEEEEEEDDEEEEEEEDNEMEEDDEEEVSTYFSRRVASFLTSMGPFLGRNRPYGHHLWSSYPWRARRLHLQGGFGEGWSHRKRGR
jgi:hypothetical protein